MKPLLHLGAVVAVAALSASLAPARGDAIDDMLNMAAIMGHARDSGFTCAPPESRAAACIKDDALVIFTTEPALVRVAAGGVVTPTQLCQIAFVEAAAAGTAGKGVTIGIAGAKGVTAKGVLICSTTFAAGR